MDTDSFDNLATQMRELNVKFEKYLIKIQTQLDVLNTEIQFCNRLMLENKDDFQELKCIMQNIITKYRLYETI